MRYADNLSNLARAGSLSATNGLASSTIYRTDTAAKVGGGLARLTGPYTGADDTTVDIEIVDNAGASTQLSAPAFSGVGNGDLSAAAASGINPQTITITLEDLGTETRHAYAPFQGVTVRAAATGGAGNAITIAVDQAGLSMATTDFATQEEIRAGSNEYEGSHWDWTALGEMTLTPEGRLPATAPRVVFGRDPQVYRAYRRYRDGRYVYGFSPSPVRDVPRGTRVRAVTGARTVVVSDGSTTNTLTGIVTLYDALRAFRDTATLLAVEGPVVDDRLPGGQGAVDLSVWTSSHVVGIDADGSYSALNAEFDVLPSIASPTETLRIQCTSAEATGRERWRVQGDVSGLLAEAITNTLYADGDYQFTIPLPSLQDGSTGNTTGTMRLDYVPEPRGDGGVLPNIEFFKPRLGAAAKNGTWTFIWTPRPPDPCDEHGVVAGGPRRECLGINDLGDENVSDASRLIRLQRLTAALRLHVGTNTGPFNVASAADIAALTRGAGILRDGLTRMMGGTIEYPAWEAETGYIVDDVVEPIARNGYRYAVTTAGESDDTAPTWGTVIGGTTNDGTVVWTCIGKTPLGMWDDAFDAWAAEAAMLASPAAISAEGWTSEKLTKIGAFLVPSTPNGCIYRAQSSRNPVSGEAIAVIATHGEIEPAWPTELNGSPANRVVDVNASSSIETLWVLTNRYWSPRQTLAVGATAQPGNGRVYRVTTAGTTGTSEPTWPTSAAGTVSDGTVTWTEIPGHDAALEINEAFFERYVTAMHDVLAAAGIDPGFEFAGTDGDGCWHDPDDDGYWQSTDGLLPAFNNLYYHSSRTVYDEEGNPRTESTREFGFGLAVGCIENLVPGDQIVLTIDGVQGASTGRGYQEGDTFDVRVIHALPVPFGGGQTGTDTLTWSVALSTDGALPDYTLSTLAPAAYNYTGTGKALSFLITPGGIPFALGDRFVIDIEGGRFRWRRDGGAWSAATDIAATALTDGLGIAFEGGRAPSWAAGDRWTWRAEATFGAVQLRTPLDGAFEWTGSTVIELAGGAIEGVGLYGHTIPADASITLTGSDDNWSTTPLTVVIPWRKGDVWQRIVANHAAYRITINRGGSLRWLYLGTGTQMQIRSGAAELGRLVKHYRLPTSFASRALGARIEHTWLPKTSTDVLLAMLEHSSEHNDGLLGIVPNDGQPETSLVRLDGDTVEIADELGYQASNVTHQRQSVTLTLEAA